VVFRFLGRETTPANRLADHPNSRQPPRRFTAPLQRTPEEGNPTGRGDKEKSPFLNAGFDPHQPNSDFSIAIPKIKEAFERKSTTNNLNDQITVIVS
jgi:hypothetical protein